MTKNTVDRALIEQALGHLINLQPKLANGLLNRHQLKFIDPYIDEAMKNLRSALAEVPLLTDAEIDAVWPSPEGTNSIRALARAIEQAVRQKAGLK